MRTRCSRCKLDPAPSGFHKGSNQCKQCVRERRLERVAEESDYLERERERSRESARKRRTDPERRAVENVRNNARLRAKIASDPKYAERYRAQTLASYYRHHEDRKARMRANYAKPEVRARIRAAQRAAQKTPEGRAKHNAANRAWKKTERGRLVGAASLHRRRLRMKASGDVSAADLRRVVSAYGPLCLYCAAEEADSFDHYVPIASGGEHSPENLVPACCPCNASKNALSAEAFVLKAGLDAGAVEERRVAGLRALAVA